MRKLKDYDKSNCSWDNSEETSPLENQNSPKGPISRHFIKMDLVTLKLCQNWSFDKITLHGVQFMCEEIEITQIQSTCDHKLAKSKCIWGEK